MKWIKIYGNALADERLLALLERLSYEGLGIYYAVLMQVEGIGEGSMPLEQIIASFNRRVKRKYILSVICDYRLFVLTDFNQVRAIHPLPGCSLADTGAHTGADAGETRAGTSESREEKNNQDDHFFLSPVLRFRKPTIEEIRDYCLEKGYQIDVEYFYNYNETRGWMIGRQLMKSWKGAIATWVRREKAFRRNEDDTLHYDNDNSINHNPTTINPEATDSDGNRYIDGRPIPKDAPPRPSPTAIWDDSTGSWLDFYR